MMSQQSFYVVHLKNQTSSSKLTTKFSRLPIAVNCTLVSTKQTAEEIVLMACSASESVGADLAMHSVWQRSIEFSWVDSKSL